MKTLKYFLSIIILISAVWSCTEEEFGDDSFVETVVAPTNVTTLFNITQDNTGLVTITPNSEGAISYSLTFGDETPSAVTILQGDNVAHTYAEGNYDVKVIAKGITGLTTEITVPLLVSFNAPENLVVEITNDEAVSKKVNVTATADFATMFDVYFGEEGNEEPVSGNIGDMVSFVYEAPGMYTIRVVAKGAAIETTEYTVEFEAIAIVQPIEAAPTPPSRKVEDVISIFSDAYASIEGTDYFPDWGQGGQGSSWAMFELDGDEMLNYIKLSYQGVAVGETVDVSGMEFLHMDIWTADLPQIETSLINGVDGDSTEKPVMKDLTIDQWTSIDIPMAEYLEQGLSVDQIFQLKFVGEPWAEGTVFIDNVYFYKTPSNCTSEMEENIDPIMGNINWTFKTNDEAHAFEAFGNIAADIVDNPLVDELNPSCNVQSYVKTAGCETWSGVGKGLSNAIDLTASQDRVFKMKVFAKDHATEVTLRLEYEPYPNADPSAEVVQTMTKVGEWEELTFDFSAHSDKTFKSIIVYFDRNNSCDDATYYFDDIVQVNGGSTPPPTGDVMDFEPGSTVYEWTGFGAADYTAIPASVIANPDASGINTSAQVVEIQKLIGAQTWAGASTPLDGIIDFSGGTTIKVKVWSPRVGTAILLKMEDLNSPKDGNSNPTVFAEVQVSTTVANAWEELSFDMTSAGSFSTSISYGNVILFPDFGVAGNGENFYFDDVTVAVKEGGGSGSGGGSGGGGSTDAYNLTLPIDFESTGFGGNWAWNVFENDSNPALEFVANPSESGINTSSNVAKITALQAGQAWVGTEVAHGEMGITWDLSSSNAIIKIMVYKTVISDVGIKLVNPTGGAQEEIKVANTKVNEWEELTFDFTSRIGNGLDGSTNIDQIVVFPDFGVRSQDNVVYFDNITFGSN